MRRLLFTSLRRRQSTQSQKKRTMSLTLSVSDPEIVSILSKYPEGDERDRFANEALRVGVRIFFFPKQNSKLVYIYIISFTDDRTEPSGTRIRTQSNVSTIFRYEKRGVESLDRKSRELRVDESYAFESFLLRRHCTRRVERATRTSFGTVLFGSRELLVESIET